jgi:GntR family transcriptional regulator
MKWSFSGKQDLYLEIAEQYKEYIRLGLLAPNEKLPSVRTAAVELGVNPNTIARAFSLLEEQGYVRSIPKKGIYVLSREESAIDSEESKSLLRALRDLGITRDCLQKWIEEVYEEND